MSQSLSTQLLPASSEVEGDGVFVSPEQWEEVRVLLGYGKPPEGYYPLAKIPSLWQTMTTTTPPNQSLDMSPPPPLRHAIDKKTWKRFRGHMAGVNISSMLMNKYERITSALWPAWFAFFIVVKPFDMDDDEKPDAVFYVFLALTIVLLGSQVYASCFKDPQNKKKLYERILDKMGPTFLAKGYRLSLGSYMEYCPMIQRHHYVIFTPDTSHLSLDSQEAAQQAIAQPNDYTEDSDEEEDDFGPYQPDDWSPLEGTWIKVHEAGSSIGLVAAFRGILSTSSLVWTFSGTDAPETFQWKRCGKGTLYGCFPHTYETGARVVTTTVTDNSQDTENSTLRYMNAVEYIPSKPGSRVLQELRKGTRLRPLQNPHYDSNGWHFYLQGEQSVWKVNDSTIIKYDFFFLEDMPSHADVLEGALESVVIPTSTGSDNDDICQVWTFSRKMT